MGKKQIEIKHGGEAMLDLLNQEQAELQKAMIEEMAKSMCLYCKEMTEEKECERGKECFDWRLKEARFYYEQGYQKIPENVVVFIPTDEQYVLLTREEYESDLTAQYDVGYEFGGKETAREIVKLIKRRSYADDETLAMYIARKFGVEME